MKNIKKIVIPVIAFMFIFLLVGCDSVSKPSFWDTRNEENEQVTEAESDMMDYLSRYKGEIAGLEIGQEQKVSYQYLGDGDLSNCMALYKVQPDMIGNFKLTISDIDTEQGLVVVAALIDDNATSMLELYSGDFDKKANPIFNESVDGETFIIGDETYYLVLMAFSFDDETAYSGEYSVKIEASETDIRIDTIKEGEEFEKLLQNNVMDVVCFEPEESGFYILDTYIKGDDSGIATIYSVLENGEQDIDTGAMACRMEAGNKYYIIYGVENASTDEVQVVLECNYFEAKEMGGNGFFYIQEDSIVVFEAPETADYLIYSVSDGNPDAYVYDENLDIVAENKSMHDAGYSKNEKDFALVVHATAGKPYYLYVYDDENEGDRLNECRLVFKKQQ